METKARETRMVKTKERRRKIGSGKERKEKTQERTKNGSKKSSRGIEDLGWRRESSKIGGRDKKIGSRKVP